MIKHIPLHNKLDESSSMTGNQDHLEASGYLQFANNLLPVKLAIFNNLLSLRRNGFPGAFPVMLSGM